VSPCLTAVIRPVQSTTPTGAAFDIVLLLHVTCVTVGLGTVVVSGVQARRLRVALARGAAVAVGPSRGTGRAGRAGAAPLGGTAGLVEEQAASELSPTLVSYYSPGVNWVARILYLVPVLGFTLLAMSGGAFGVDDTWVRWGIGLWVVAIVCAEGILWPAERRVQVQLACAGGGAAAPELLAACRTTYLAAGGVISVLLAAIVLMVAQP